MLTRREAVELGLLGTLAAAFRPAFAAGNPVAAGKGEFADSVLADMKLRKIKIDIGLNEPFKVVHATDSHFTYVSAEDFEKLDSKSMEWYNSRSKIFAGGVPGLAAALLHAKNLNVPLFHTGDLLDFPSKANLDMIRRDLSLRNWFYSLGNHEYHGWGPGKPAIAIGRSAEERAAGRALFASYMPNAIPVASRVIGGVNFVQYDNSGFSDHMGCWQLGQIKKEFAKGLPVVLLCHMPFFTEKLVEQMVVTKKLVKEKINDGYLQGVPWANSWGGRKELLAWLKEQPLLKAVICGHLHGEYCVDFSKTAKQYVADANYKGFVYEYTFS